MRKFGKREGHLPRSKTRTCYNKKKAYLYLKERTWGQQSTGPAEVTLTEAFEGASTSIYCRAYSPEHSNHTTVRWLYEKNGRQKILTSSHNRTLNEDSELKERVTLEDVSTLVISGTRVQDERIYICQVENPSSGSRESHVQLRVYKAPEQPELKLSELALLLEDSGVEVGSCESKNGYPAPNITWYKNEFPLRHGHEGVEVSNQVTQESTGFVTVKSMLFMPVLKSDDNAIFYCEASYHLPGKDYMMESKKGNITVYYPNIRLEMFIVDSSKPVKEGDTVELRCEGDGNPQPEINYFKTDNDGTSLGTGSSLILKNVQRGDSGGYKCQGTDFNYFGDLSTKTELQVHFLDPPVFSVTSSVQVTLGDNLSVSCQANGSSQTQISWKINGKDIAQEPVLILNEITHDMSGNYTCVAELLDVPEMIITKDLEITVLGVPEVDVSSQVLSTQENAVETVTCIALGHPTATIIWSINGTVTETNDGHRVTSELMFQVTQDLINTSISCVASNTYGSRSKEIKLEHNLVSLSAGSCGTVEDGSGTLIVFWVKSIGVKPSVCKKVSASANRSADSQLVESKREGSHGVIIVVVIVCILLLAILGAVLYFLYKKGRIACGRSGKQDITKPGEKEQIVVEMKPDSPAEESVLLPGSHEKKSPGDQEKYMDLRN
ncbi:cell surface glycoprotein MUC18 [Pelodytes ibericus]